MNTQDFSQFGYREIAMARDLLDAYCDRNDCEFLGSDIKVEMNMSSGYVFLVDEDYNVAMVNGDRLEDFFCSPYEGHEGFLEDLLEIRDEMHPEDQEWLDSISEEQTA